ncbi:MAG: hypothetical protein M3P52_06110 [Actinomycetota bacterium]|nr:hypothetical protein [Actinomycetota bacterium]
MQRILIGRVVATFGAVVAVAGTFLPWLRSGTRRRSSYEIFSLVDRLGISRSSLVGWGLRLWPIVPFLLACAITLQWFPRKWATGTTAAAAVVYAGVVSAAVRSAPSTSLIKVEFGPLVTLLGAITLACGSLVTFTADRLSNRP